MWIMQFTRFKTDNREEMIKSAKQAKKIFEKHGAEFLRLSPVPHRHVGWRVAGCLALGGIGEGPGIREADGTYEYLC